MTRSTPFVSASPIMPDGRTALPWRQKATCRPRHPSTDGRSRPVPSASPGEGFSTFVRDFVAAGDKVMNADRFDRKLLLARPRLKFRAGPASLG